MFGTPKSNALELNCSKASCIIIHTAHTVLLPSRSYRLIKNFTRIKKIVEKDEKLYSK